MSRRVVTHRDLEVYNRAFDAAMEIFRISADFPKEERYALTDQIRRSLRSVCANLAEAWRGRRYTATFVHKLSIAEGEAAETQVWIEFAVHCGYLTSDVGRPLYETYNSIIGTLVGMINYPETWTIPSKKIGESEPPYRTDDSPTESCPF